MKTAIRTFPLLTLALLLWVGSRHPAFATPSDASVIADGRAWTKAYYDGKTQALWDQFDAKMKEAIGSKKKFDAIREQIQSKLGAETKVISETVEHHNGFAVYVRLVHFKLTAETPIKVTFAFDSTRHISGFYIKPA
jgi:hypothetical protein